MSNYNKIKADLDKLRLLVEQSELWVYKKKESISKEGDEKDEKDTAADGKGSSAFRAKNSAPSLNNKSTRKKRGGLNELKGDQQVGDQFVLQELEDGPEMDEVCEI